MIEAAACVPFGSLITMCCDAAGIFDHARQMHEVPCHEGCVALCEIVFRTTGTGTEIGRTWTGLAESARVGLWRNDIAKMLE